MERKVIKRSTTIFGDKRFYFDEKTRVELGFHISDLGVSFQLQRKKGWFWAKTASTYQGTHLGKSFEQIADYLFWYESALTEQTKMP